MHVEIIVTSFKFERKISSNSNVVSDSYLCIVTMKFDWEIPNFVLIVLSTINETCVNCLGCWDIQRNGIFGYVLVFSSLMFSL